MEQDGESLGNNDHGIRIDGSAHDNTIGGTAARAANLIAGNGEDGVHIALDAYNNRILGNRIGLDLKGNLVANGGDGVQIGSDRVLPETSEKSRSS